jgi:hypothetical protein
MNSLHELASWTRFMNSLHELASWTRFMNSLHELASWTRFINSLNELASWNCFMNLLHELALGTHFGIRFENWQSALLPKYKVTHRYWRLWVTLYNGQFLDSFSHIFGLFRTFWEIETFWTPTIYFLSISFLKTWLLPHCLKTPIGSQSCSVFVQFTYNLFLSQFTVLVTQFKFNLKMKTNTLFAFCEQRTCSRSCNNSSCISMYIGTLYYSWDFNFIFSRIFNVKFLATAAAAVNCSENSSSSNSSSS